MGIYYSSFVSTILFIGAWVLHLLHTAHAVALLVFVVVPFMAQNHLLFPQTFVVDLDARGNGGMRGVVPEDVTHVVQQARG